MALLSLQVFSHPGQATIQHSPDPSRGQRYVILLERRGIMASVKLASQLLVPASTAQTTPPPGWTDLGDA